MTDETYDYDDDNDEPQTNNGRNWRRDLEEQARKGREAQEALQKQMEETRTAQRELAMMRAGIDLDTPLGQTFAKANPDLVDVDTIRTEWQKLTPAPEPTAEQAAMQRIAAAQAGGDPSGGADARAQFTTELDSIPTVVEGNYNPEYVQQVLRAANEQAAREGRPFEVSQGSISWQPGSPGPVPATKEM